MQDSNITQWTDLLLLEAIRDGVSLAQRILYERHAAYAIKLAYRYTRERAQAEEIVQDVWLALHLHIRKQDPITEFNTYLAAAIVNRCRKILARRSKEIVSLDVDALLYLETTEPHSVSMLDSLSGESRARYLGKSNEQMPQPT